MIRKPRATYEVRRPFAQTRWPSYKDGDLVFVSGLENPAFEEQIQNSGVRLRSETRHFSVFRTAKGTLVLHRVRPEKVDNDLAETVASELVRSGVVSGPDAFERCFAGVVESSAASYEEAWRLFYRNTLGRLERFAAGPRTPEEYASPVAVFGGIYARAASLVTGGSLLDVGTCFGFFPLLARREKDDRKVAALDLSPEILALARRISFSGSDDGVEFMEGDACRLPFAKSSFDTVTALHLLEHLPNPLAGLAVTEMCRVAGRRVVIAVPLEKVADPAYGHVRTFDRESLLGLTRRPGWRCGFSEYLGGWVVMERSSDVDYNSVDG